MKVTLSIFCLLLTIAAASADTFEEQLKQIPECHGTKKVGFCNLRNDLNIDGKVACAKEAIRNEKICDEKSKPILEAMELQKANGQP